MAQVQPPDSLPTAQIESPFKHAQKAGEIAQAVFYSFIRNTWAYDMSNVRIVRDQYDDIVKIEVIAGPGVNAGPGGESTCERYAGGWLVKFPHAAFEEGDQQAMRALLADQNSIWAFVSMHNAVGTLFAGRRSPSCALLILLTSHPGLVQNVEKDIKEVLHYVSSSTQRLVDHKGRFGFARVDREDLLYPDYDPKGNLKGIYCITLKDGTRIALDLAGAQYDTSHTTVMYWQDYLDRWSHSIKYRLPFRSHYSKHAKNMSGYHCITDQTIIMEQTAYLNVLITHCKRELGFDLNELINMGAEDFGHTKNKFIDAVTEYLQKRCSELDDGSKVNCLTESFDLRHPKVVKKLLEASASSIKIERPESIPLDIGDMRDFDWATLRKLIQMPSTEVKYHEKKKAKALLAHRCVYKMPGDWKLVFLADTLPSLKVPSECVSENPYWKAA